MADTVASLVANTRRPQMFPVLTAAELRRIERFGRRQHYRDGDLLAKNGAPSPGMGVVLNGKIAVLRHDGLGRMSPITELGPGEFAAELAELSGQPSPVDVRAEGDVDTLIVPADGVRALVVAEADLGVRIVRALILRRVYLIEAKAAGPILVGAQTLPNMIRLQGFLARNGQPYSIFDPRNDPDAVEVIAGLSPEQADYPLVVCPDGTLLRNPSERALALSIGLLDETTARRIYYVAVVGAGPAGLSTAVYAASEGLSALVVDTHAFGGQAGASAHRELSRFSHGHHRAGTDRSRFRSGQEIRRRVRYPAHGVAACLSWPWAAHDPGDVGRLARAGEGRCGRFGRPLSKADAAQSRAVPEPRHMVLGVADRGETLRERRGDHHRGRQLGRPGRVFLSAHAAKVQILVRGSGLAETMSLYLAERIAATPNVEVLTGTEIVELLGSAAEGLQGVRWHHRPSGAETLRPIRHVFLFLGAEPATEWLKDCGVDVDPRGFVRTGADVVSLTGEHRPSTHETSMAGVFAVGDVRYNSVKRVGGAIGEGANVVAQLHGALAAMNASH